MFALFGRWIWFNSKATETVLTKYKYFSVYLHCNGHTCTSVQLPNTPIFSPTDWHTFLQTYNGIWWHTEADPVTILLKSHEFMFPSWHCVGLFMLTSSWKHFLPYWPLVWGIHRSPMNSPHKGQWSAVNSPHKGPVTWKMFPFDDVIMHYLPPRVLWFCSYGFYLLMIQPMCAWESEIM